MKTKVIAIGIMFFILDILLISIILTMMPLTNMSETIITSIIIISIDGTVGLAMLKYLGVHI